jgi:hypothetical protein
MSAGRAGIMPPGGGGGGGRWPQQQQEEADGGDDRLMAAAAAAGGLQRGRWQPQPQPSLLPAPQAGSSYAVEGPERKSLRLAASQHGPAAEAAAACGGGPLVGLTFLGRGRAAAPLLLGARDDTGMCV